MSEQLKPKAQQGLATLKRAGAFFVTLFSLFALAAKTAVACPAGTVDVLNYMLPSDTGKGNRMQDGEIFYTHAGTVAGQSGFYIVKSDNSRYYEAFSYDDNYIYIVYDTTWATGAGNVRCNDDGTDAMAVYYSATDDLGRRHFPRCMEVGKQYQVIGYVVGMSKSNCHMCWTPYSGVIPSTAWISEQGNKTLPNGVAVGDALTIKTSGGENFIFSRGLGWVGWEGYTHNYYTGQRDSASHASPPCGDTPAKRPSLDESSSRCQAISDNWARLSSTGDSVQGALREEKTKSCAGELAEVLLCLAQKVINGWFTREKSFIYNITQTPRTFLSLHQGAISEAGGQFEGAVARALPPKYLQEGRDPREALTDAKGQTVLGQIVSNQQQSQGLSRGSGSYDLDKYSTIISVPDVKAIFDSFSFLRQIFVPGAPAATLPDIECDYTSTIYPEEEGRTVTWKAESDNYGGGVDTNDPDCDEDPETVDDGVCDGGTVTGVVEAPLGGNQSKVSYVDKTSRVVGGSGGGALDIFIIPGMRFKRGEEVSVDIPFTYDSESLGPLTKTSELPLKDPGTEAGRCIVEQFLMPPSSAATGVCEEATEEGGPIFCEVPPEGLNDACRRRGSGSHYIPACSLATDRFAQLTVLICYGNAYRLCDTDPVIPGPNWDEFAVNWIDPGRFPNGTVLFNSYTYEVPPGGVLICDADTFACDNPVCTTGEWDFMKESSQSAATTPATLNTTAGNAAADSGNFWTKLGTFAGNLFGAIFNL